MDSIQSGDFTLAEAQLTIQRAEALGFVLAGFVQQDGKVHVGNAQYPANFLHYTPVPAPPSDIELVAASTNSGLTAQLAKRQSEGWLLVAFGTLYIKSQPMTVAAFRHA